MALVMHIAFDNSSRLSTNVHYFEYAGVRFKLVQNNPRKWSDVLLTITGDDDAAARENAFRAAGEFLSALSWHNHSAVALRYVGGYGASERLTLRQAKCHVFDFPQVPFHGAGTGFGISQIAEIVNDVQRIALTLFREALSANKDLLAFLLFWQIMEIRTQDPVGWINKTFRRHPIGLHLDPSDVARLPLRGRSLGQYLLDDCRHAIAHIRRKPGKLPLQFDVSEEIRRLVISTRVVKVLAEHYIRTELGVNSRMVLVRLRPHAFPVFVNQAFMLGNRTIPIQRSRRRRV